MRIVSHASRESRITEPGEVIEDGGASERDEMRPKQQGEKKRSFVFIIIIIIHILYLWIS